MDRRAAQRRKLLQPPPTDIVELLNDIAAALDNMNETTPGADDDWIKR
jgi:hypothetical protein